MNIHEYQSKAILRSYGVNVPEGKPAFSVEEAVENARELGTDVVVVKAQIHAGAAARREASRSSTRLKPSRERRRSSSARSSSRIRRALPVSASTVCSSRPERPSRRNTISLSSLTARRRVSS